MLINIWDWVNTGALPVYMTVDYCQRCLQSPVYQLCWFQSSVKERWCTASVHVVDYFTLGTASYNAGLPLQQSCALSMYTKWTTSTLVHCQVYIGESWTTSIKLVHYQCTAAVDSNQRWYTFKCTRSRDYFNSALPVKSQSGTVSILFPGDNTISVNLQLNKTSMKWCKLMYVGKSFKELWRCTASGTQYFFTSMLGLHQSTVMSIMLFSKFSHRRWLPKLNNISGILNFIHREILFEYHAGIPNNSHVVVEIIHNFLWVNFIGNYCLNYTGDPKSSCGKLNYNV